MRHLLERTSPKGHKFMGSCVLCGKRDLTIEDFNIDECTNPGKLSQAMVLVKAVKGG